MSDLTSLSMCLFKNDLVYLPKLQRAKLREIYHARPLGAVHGSFNLVPRAIFAFKMAGGREEEKKTLANSRSRVSEKGFPLRRRGAVDISTALESRGRGFGA